MTSRKQEVDKAAMCLNKARHATRREAAVALNNQLSSMRRRKHGSGNGVRLYVTYCPFCDGYHVGSQDNKRRERGRD